jgi:polyadenylate-binding protein
MAQTQVQVQQQAVQVAAGAAPTQFVSTSLYVGDLEPNVSEAQLYEMFSQVGQVVSIRVCRDLITRRSLGYAYVNYNNAQDATRALELLNFTVVNGKPIRIMFSHRDPSIRKSGTANIFIKNLDKAIDNKALHDTFSAFGGILSCKVATDCSGQSKGYGFVQFEQEESAQTAIEKVNGMLLNDKQVFVGPFVRRQERDQAGGISKFNNVYVKNLADSTSDDELKKVFGAFGTISSAVVMRDNEGKSKCFGFVNFEHADDAAKAVDGLNGKKIDEKEWYVCRAQKKSEREAELRAKFEQERKERIEKYQGVNLYLKNLDDTVDDEKLRELFAEYGTITSCKVMRDPQGQSRGSGFVAFSSPEEATHAVTEMNGKMVGSKPLYVALAQRKEERRARLQAAFAQMRTPVGPAVPTSLPMYHPGAPGMGPQMPYYGQHPSGPIPLQPTAFGYQPQIIRPSGGQIPNYIGYPNVPLRQGQQGQRAGGRRGGAPQQQQQQQPQQQMIQRGGNRNFRYTPNARNTPDAAVPPQGIMGTMLPVPLEIGGVPVANADSGVLQPLPISALASALASAPPEQQRAMLGEQLYPLVDALEHDHAGKVTGMLLEMDQTEVLHLIESPEALKAKVAEAMEVLRMAQAVPAPSEQLGNLSISDSA